MRKLRVVASFVGVVCAALSGVAWGQNTSPQPPVIREPILGVEIDPSDVHMEVAPMVDVDAGDVHLCSDFQLVDIATNTLVWRVDCITGPAKVHVHLGDGRFVGQWEADRTLQPGRQYRIRVRFSDDSDQPNRWSAWSEREFMTGPIAAVFPLSLDDIATTPPPRLALGTATYDIPSVSGRAVRLVSHHDDVLLSIEPGTGANTIINPPPFDDHEDVQVLLVAGSQAWNVPALDIEVSGGDNVRRTILAPAVSIPAGQTRRYWITTNGSTFVAVDGAHDPDFTTPARLNASPWTTAPGYRVTPFASGLRLPVQIAFLPDPGPDEHDPFFYVTELYGDVKVVLRDGHVEDFATNVLNFNPFGDFPGAGEIGTAGICVDPTTGDVFVSTVSALVDGDAGSGVFPRIFKFTSTNGGLSEATRTTIFFPVGANSGMSASHQISTISIGPDGNLYVHMGDAFETDNGLDLNDFRGKVLRMTKSGQPVATNPFYNAGDGITARDYVFAYGFRNPFGGVWKRGENLLYFVENGPGTDRLGIISSGTSYGFDGSDESMLTNALFTWQPAVAPVNIAFVESGVFGGSGFHPAVRGRGYITQSGSTWASGPGTGREKVISEFIPGVAGGPLLRGPLPVATYNGFGKSTTSALAAGPDGLYFAELYKEDDFNDPTARGSRIFKLSYTPVSDCNGNGIDDEIDIAQSVSSDCNANLIPDECDVQLAFSTDCDNNGLIDDCEALSPVDLPFTSTAGPFQIRGLAQRTGGVLQLTRATDPAGVGSAWVYPLSLSPGARWRVEFDFRMTGGATRGRDLGVGIFRDSVFDETLSFGGNGPGTGLFVRFATADDIGNNVNRVQALSDEQILSTYEPSFNISDNQWRRVRISFGPSGLTTQVQTAPGVWETIFRNLAVPSITPDLYRMGFGSRVTIDDKGTHEIDNVRLFVFNQDRDVDGDYVLNPCECGSIDFNNDGLFPDDLDLLDFLRVLGGGFCSTGNCGSIDFNSDGLFPDDADLATFLRVLAGGPC